MAQELSQDIKRLQEALYELDNFHGALKGITSSKNSMFFANGSASIEQIKIIFALKKCLCRDSTAGRIMYISPIQ